MAGWDAITALMDEVGGTLGVAETIELPESGAWRIGAESGAELVVAYEPEADRLEFRGWLGTPEAALREATYALLLAYNGQSQTTGGGLIGLAAPGGELSLRYAVPATGLEADSLRGLILDLLEVVGGWRAYVGREAGTPPAPDLDLLRFQAIRG